MRYVTYVACVLGAVKRNTLTLACLLAAAGCFYGADMAAHEAKRLSERPAEMVDQVLGLGRYQKPARTLPNGVEEENPWVLDPAETVKQPDNRKLMEQAEAEFAPVRRNLAISTALQTAGYALSGIAVLLLALAAVPELLASGTARSPEKEVGDEPPPSA